MLLLLIKARRQTHHQGKPTRSWLIESERSVTRSALCLASSKPIQRRREQATHISSMLGWKILFMKPILGDLNGY